MAVSVPGLAFGSIAEEPCYFRLALHVGNLGKVQVAPIGLALAGKGILKVGVCLGSFQTVHCCFLPERMRG